MLRPFERALARGISASSFFFFFPMADAGAVAFLRSVQIKDIPLKRKGVVVLHRGDSVVKALSVRACEVERARAR